MPNDISVELFAGFSDFNEKESFVFCFSVWMGDKNHKQIRNSQTHKEPFLGNASRSTFRIATIVDKYSEYSLIDT